MRHLPSKSTPFWLLVSLLPGLAFAAEGMWTLDNLPAKKMQAEYGFTPDQAWVTKAMHSSLRIAGGCSASFVSPNGLVMTNHHCAASCLAQLSTASKDLVKNGFIANKPEEELSCPEIELNRLENISDVTDQVKQATAGLEGKAFRQAQNAVKAKLESACVGGDKKTMRCDVVDLYHGGRYHLYKYHRFQDARLVWAPEKAMAFFGGDPDNFNFPRYNLDITLLRAYENGKPVQPVDYFPFSKQGAAEGEMVFVTGHPGSTQRQLTMAQLQSVRDFTLVDGLLRLAEVRGVLEQYGKTGAEAGRTADRDLFGIENSYKAFHGRLETLLDPAFMQQKQEEEASLRKFVAANPELSAKVGGAWDAIAQSQQAYRQIKTPFVVLERSQGFYTDYFRFARTLVRGSEERGLPNAERLPEFADAKLPEVEQRLFSDAPVYPELEKVKLSWSLAKMREWLGPDDAMVKRVLGAKSPDQIAAELIGATKLGDPAARKALWTGGKDAIAKSDDPFIKLALLVDGPARTLRKRYEVEVESVEQKNSELIAQARFAQQGAGAYPDATFTLRLSYGEVKGWQEGEHAVAPFTTLGGAFDRATGVAPFALPASWERAKGKLGLNDPFDMATTNDIIGGNSGSPMINRKGEVVGLIFDGNIHSLGGAFWYDPRYNRAVAVHSDAILESLDKIYGAPALAKELRGQ
ncbi:MAG TPA: S46 family peptidase [Burkholderiaceae bacterium]